MRQYCEGCRLKVAPHDPERMVHRKLVWHVPCFKKYHEPLKLEEVPGMKVVNRAPTQTIERKG